MSPSANNKKKSTKHGSKKVSVQTSVAKYSKDKIFALLRAHKNDDALYDKDNGIRQEILRSIGFHDAYLTYHKSQRRHEWGPENWVSAQEAYNSMIVQGTSKLLHWTWVRGTPKTRGNNTHARGLFVDTDQKVVITYEPRYCSPDDYANARVRYYNKAHTEFLNKFRGYKFLTVCGNQQKTWDCEKRVLRFGMCCLPGALQLLCNEELGLKDKIKVCTENNCPLRVSAILKFYPRRK